MEACNPQETKTVITECRYCQIAFKTSIGRGQHERQCLKNPNRKENPNIGRTPWNKGLDKSDPRVEKNGKAVKKALRKLYDNGYKHVTQTDEYWTKERRAAKSKWKRKLHCKNPELHPNRLLAGNRNSMTYPEKVAYECLTNLGIKFEHQKNILKYYVDFCIDNIVIEIDGEQWHPKDNKKDALRDAEISALGYVVYRIRSKERIEDRLREILSGYS